MISIVWPGDIQPSQAYGCTDLSVEPFWTACKLEGGHFHCGIDVPMNIGTPLKAARAGTVTVAEVGLLRINVDCGDHSEDDNYVHVSATMARVGDKVARGQVIAYSGNALPGGFGATTGPHLHFEVQLGHMNFPGTSKDPVPVVTAAFGAASGGIDLATLDDIQQTVNGIYDAIEDHRSSLLNDPNVGVGALHNQATDIQSKIADLQAKIAAVQPVDLSAISSELGAIKAGQDALNKHLGVGTA